MTTQELIATLLTMPKSVPVVFDVNETYVRDERYLVIEEAVFVDGIGVVLA
jgi:hypothetical protein